MQFGSDIQPVLTLSDGTVIKTCHAFKYLGSPVANPDEVIGDRLSLAWAAVCSLRPIFTSNAQDAITIRLFKTAVESICSYSLEAVPLTTTRAASLDASHRRLLRAALDIRWPDVVSNVTLMQRTGVIPLSQTVRLHRLRVVGHAVRAATRGQNPLGDMLMNLDHPRNRRHGQSRTVTLVNEITEDLSYVNLKLRDVSKLTSKQYKQVTASFIS